VPNDDADGSQSLLYCRTSSNLQHDLRPLLHIRQIRPVDRLQLCITHRTK